MRVCPGPAYETYTQLMARAMPVKTDEIVWTGDADGRRRDVTG
jgi:hypothetical protein